MENPPNKTYKWFLILTSISNFSKVDALSLSTHCHSRLFCLVYSLSLSTLCLSTLCLSTLLRVYSFAVDSLYRYRTESTGGGGEAD